MTHSILNDAPEWQMDDAYGSLADERWLKSEARVRRLTDDIRGMLQEGCGEDVLSRALTAYEEALTLQSSMQTFAKCLGAKDSTDPAPSSAMNLTSDLLHELEKASAPLFAALAALSPASELWAKKPFSHWQFAIRERQNDWHNKLSESDAGFFSDIEAKAFMPLGTMHKSLQKLVDFEAKSTAGETVHVRAAKMVAVLKGDPDPVLRRTTGDGMHAWYGRHGDLYPIAA